MMENIQSLFFIYNLFSILDERHKLILVKYNRGMQGKIGINLNTYKIFSGKYFIYETKEKDKIKEFDCYTDALIYEGGYLNGKRNGKGKEYYYDGKLKFEGEYLNGKRNGKGKEYHMNEKLKFEGVYLDGKNGMDKDMLWIMKLYIN